MSTRAQINNYKHDYQPICQMRTAASNGVDQPCCTNAAAFLHLFGITGRIAAKRAQAA